MALDNYENAAYWLSTDAEMEKRRNPYLGLHDPKYKSGMLKCGSTKDSVSIMIASSENGNEIKTKSDEKKNANDEKQEKKQ
jgi:hypothetical protein